jgi:hypothetical protein
MKTSLRLLLVLWCCLRSTVAQEMRAPALNEAPRFLGSPSGQPAASGFAPQAVTLTVDPSHREESRIFYNAVYSASENVAIGWTGDTVTGNAGATSQAFRDAVLRRVNYFRAMAGVPATITFSALFNGKDQKAALMMSANNQLDHFPPTTWKFYSTDGAEAAGNSNIYLSRFGPDAITGYIEDPGANNAVGGHRRWILYPNTHTMGTGDVPVSGTYASANALWVFDPNESSTRPVTRDFFVAWPPPGYVPYTLIFPRWSFAYPGANFAAATVTMTRGGASVPLVVQSRTDNGYGENTLIWVPDGLSTNSAPPAVAPASDMTTHVTVANFTAGGITRSFSYDVVVFDPATTGADTFVPAIAGSAQPVVGAANDYTFTPVPKATGYQWRSSLLTAYGAVEGAENGVAGVTVQAPAGYDPISTAVFASGAASFHLTHPGFENQSVALNPLLLVSAGSQVKFKSRLRFATPDEIAHLQVSEDDGLNWSDLYTQAGNNTSGEGAFVARTASLAAYAGKLVRLRFLYEYIIGGNAYTQTGSIYGWYVDDVAVTNASQAGPFTTTSVASGTQFSFVPAQTGSFFLQVVPQFFSQYYLPLGAGTVVNAVPPGTSVGFERPAYTIRDADPSGQLSINLVRGGDPALAFSVDFSTTDGSATAPGDYTAQTNFPVAFAANQMTATVTVDIKNPTGFQGDRSFTISLSGATNNATITSPNSVPVTIHDSLAGELAFGAAAYQKTQAPTGDSLLTIEVNRTDGTYGASSITVAVTGGTATYGTDYVLPPSPVTLSWLAGEGGAKSFDLVVKGGSIAAGVNKTVLLALQSATGGVALPDPQTATVTLTGVDTTPPAVTITRPLANQRLTAASVSFSGTIKDAGGVHRVEISLNHGPPQNATLTAGPAGVTWSLTATPEQGLNTVQVQGFDLQGNASAPVSRNFTFANLRPPLAGTYQGLVNPVAGAADEFNHYGLVTVTVSATGTFSGKLAMGGAVFVTRGIFLTDGEARFGRALTATLPLVKIAKPANLPLGSLSLLLDTGAGHQVTGKIVDDTGTSLALLAHADQWLYTARKNPVAPLRNVLPPLLDSAAEKGRYTAVFQAGTAPNNGALKDQFPQGDGWGKVTVTTAGQVKITGRLADGAMVSYMAGLSPLDHWPVYLPLYGGNGFITGEVAFLPGQPASDASGPGMQWFKAAGLARQTNYPDGWPQGITVNFAAAKFLPPKKPTLLVPHPPNPDTVLGAGLAPAATSATVNLTVALANGGLGASTENDASIDALSKVTVLGATASQSGADTLTTRFVPSTGMMSGTFIHPGTGKAISYQGIVFQRTHTAAGCFLYSPAKGTAFSSGSVRVVGK